MVALELGDDLQPGHCKKMAMCNVRSLDLWECKSFEEKLRAKLMVWEATKLVEGAKMGVKGLAYLPNSYGGIGGTYLMSSMSQLEMLS